MHIKIQIGEINQSVEYIKFQQPSFLDDVVEQKKFYYDFIVKNMINKTNVVITNIDMYLLYLTNNCMMSYIVKDTDIKTSSRKDKVPPQLDPNKVKIFEVSSTIGHNLIQGEDGLISGNYFDKLMKVVMDDFYICLNYYGDHLEK